MGWWYVVYWIATLILSEVLRPKVNVTDAAAVNAEDADMPVVSSTKPIPVIWGKIRMRDPNLTWYGDYFTIPIKKRAGKGGFLGTGKTIWQTVGYRYYWGQQLALCHGPVTLHRIWAEEREIWSGTSTGGLVVIDNEGLYGGEDNGGGLAGKINFIPGSQTQDVDPYLTKKLTNVPAYRGVASCVWYGPSMTMPARNEWIDAILDITDPSHAPHYSGTKQSGYIGTSPIPRVMSFELSRYPSNLVPAKSKVGDDCNPAELIYECLTTDPNGPDGWGMGLSAALIDVTAFTSAANKLYDEGFGISMSWNTQTPVEDTISEVCRVIDAVCYRDFRTGLYTLKLIRGGYSTDTLPVLDESNIIEMENFSQAGIDGTTNDVIVNYTDRSQNYKKLSARAQDLANMRTQADVVAASFNYLSVTTATLADRLANRELFAGSNPIAKVDAIVNRQAYSYGPGDLFVVKWADLGINNIVMRVQKTAVGLPKANRIRMSLVQDVFNLGSASYQVPGGTSWTDPVVNPIPITVQKAIELPYYFNTDQNLASYMVCAQRPNSGCVTFEVWEKLSSATDFVYRDTCQTYTPSGVLASPYQSKQAVDSVGFTIVGNVDINSLSGSSDTDIRNGANLAVFESGEFFAFSGFTDNLNGTITLTGIWGGLFDTVPSYHAAGERIWFFSYGASNPEDKVGQADTINVKNLPFGPRGAITLAQATATNLTLTGRNTKPYPPAYVTVNSIPNPTMTTGSAVVTWKHRVKSQTLLRQDDTGPSAPEGTYTVRVYVGGTLKRTYQTTDNTLKSGTPGIFNMSGLVMIDTNTFAATTCYAKYVDWMRAQIPARIFKATSSAISDWCGAIGEVGKTDGTGTAARFQGIHHPVKDSGGNVFVLDNGCYIRKITSGGVVTTWMSLAAYSRITVDPADGVTPRSVLPEHVITSMTIDGSDNLYVFSNALRQILKITPVKVVTVVAGNPNEMSGVRNDGTGTGASFSPDCEIASDASGNLFVQEYWGGVNTLGTLRYCTNAGVVTTLQQSSGEFVGQFVVIGSDAYYSGFFDRFGAYFFGVRKCTPAGVVTTFVNGYPSGVLGIAHLTKDPGGFLGFSGYGPTTGNPTFGKIDSGGNFTIVKVDSGDIGYSCAQRVQDSANGTLPVEIRIKQTSGTLESLENSTGQFQMTGFGMCFGQTFGGMQL